MRILHVIGAMDRGGVETWLLHILRRIDRQRYQMDFLVHHNRRFDFSDEIESLGSRIIMAGDHRNWARYSRRFSEVIRQYGPYDVVHSHVRRFSGFVARLARREGVPVRIAHSHTQYEAEWASASWSRRVYFALMASWIHRHVTVGLAASVPAASDLFGSRWESDSRFRVLSYGLDLDPFRAPVDRAAVRDELGIPRDAFVIGHVGRLTPEKNHELLLKIAAELAPDHPAMRLLLVGGGALQSQIERSIAMKGLNGRVILAGSRPDVPRLVRGAMDVFVFPSQYEGLGLALVEAQAAGLPCLASDGVPPEADVVPGLVRRVRLSATPAEWARAILEHQPCITPWDALEAVNHSRFSIDSSLEALTGVYQAGLSAPPRRPASLRALLSS